MEYENEESGIKIIDKRKKVEEPKPSFGRIFLHSLKVCLGGAAIFTGLFFVGWLIKQLIGIVVGNFAFMDLLVWFWSLNIYVQVAVGATLLVLSVSFISAILIYFGDDS